MKPLNANEQGCDPISSNCVIWQGPDIPCISLCKGDTISDVVYKLATSLCEIVELLNINTYEEALSVFNLAIGAGAPPDFEQLIKFILDRIHNLEECTGCTPDCNGESELVLPEEVSNPCCDALVDIASCFEYEDPGSGDWMTQMTLAGYVHAIGNEICDILTILDSNGFTLKNHETRITDLEGRSTSAPITLPQITPVCVLPSVQTDLADVTSALEAQFCELRTVTGLPNDLSNGMAAPNSITVGKQMCNQTQDMTSLPGWSAGITLAESMTNVWLTLEDLRCAVDQALLCCPEPCETYAVQITASYTAPILSIWFQGEIPSGFGSCDPLGTYITIQDTAGNVHREWVNFVYYMTAPTPVPVTISLNGTPIDDNLDFTISGIACIKDSNGTQCERTYEYILRNTAECPPITLSSPLYDQINYWLTSSTGNHTYEVQLWSEDGSTMISSHTFSTTAITVTPGIFTGLASGTTYRIRVKATTNSTTITCPDQLVTTLVEPCLPPTSVAATTSIP